MLASFNSICCPRNNKANKICLTHTCQGSPFQCQTINCPCTLIHNRCKSMQWNSAIQYLQNWTNGIGKQGKEFVNRIQKIYVNLNSRLEREKKLFDQFCKDLFLGKDYSKLMRLVEKRQFKSITSQLLSSSLRPLTQPTDYKSFSSFTINQLKQIDQLADQLLLGLDSLYKSKEIKTANLERPKRANSAILFRQTSKEFDKNNSTFDYKKSKISTELINLKIDITYPKSINSKILTEASQINKLLMRKVKKYNFVYRATESSFKICQFYHKMKAYEKQILENASKQNKTVQLYSLIITKNQFNKIIGGCTPIKWEEMKNQKESEEQQNNPLRQGNRKKNHQKYKSDASAKTFLFSLDLMQRYELKNPSQAIYCGRKSIGFGHGDLKIVEKGNQFRKSFCKFPISYNYPLKPYSNWSKSSMELSGCRYSVFFKLIEWEAFLVEF